MAEDLGSYPHKLAGQPCPPPGTPSARVLAMAAEAARRTAPGLDMDDLPVFGAGDWRMAASLVILADEANHANPTRDKSSDGTVGDARHRALAEASDHNPWVTDDRGMGVVRARDLDSTGLPLAVAFERARVKAYKGELPQLRAGGYLIYAGKITAPDFTGWRVYSGSNPHVLHGHVSVSTEQARYDDRRPWGIFTEQAADPTPPPPRTPAPAPAKTEPVNVRWLERGPGHYKPGDPRHQATRNLQRRLQTRFPAYARHLVVDGQFGAKTEAAVREYQRRKHIEENGIAGPLTLSRLGL
jgi:peptidoglycan hydrolase-like protein with peptidoglycan-binding domain